MTAEAVNERPDKRFLPLAEFTDQTTLKVVVEDVDEPPVFLSSVYSWKLPENVAAGTVVGSVGARDVDAANKPIRWVSGSKSQGWDHDNDKVAGAAAAAAAAGAALVSSRLKNHSISNNVTASIFTLDLWIPCTCSYLSHITLVGNEPC